MTADKAEVLASGYESAICQQEITGANVSKSAAFALGNPRSIR